MIESKKMKKKEKVKKYKLNSKKKMHEGTSFITAYTMQYGINNK